MELRFTVHGNQENSSGNPIPYHRSTQGAKWNPAHKRYLAWKDYVREALLAAYKDDSQMALIRNPFKHPVIGSPEGRVIAKIFFGPETHADPDNIVKGILDAVFENDKHVDVETYHSCKCKNPRVEVTVLLGQKTQEKSA